MHFQVKKHFEKQPQPHSSTQQQPNIIYMFFIIHKFQP
jgi:hypothetical protein